MKILYATPECAPWVKTGGLGDVSGALPRALVQMGHDVKVLMPAYPGMRPDGELAGLHTLAPADSWPAAQLIELRRPGEATLLLLSCPSLYAVGEGPYGNGGDPMRFGMLGRVAAWLGTAASPIGWMADVVHAHDWPCALAPLYLRQSARDQEVAASVMTIHNMAFQGRYPMAACDLLGIDEANRGTEGVEFWGDLSMLKAGLQFADAITTVSPTYAREIQTPEHGFGLDGVLRARAAHLSGILNGIDDAVWNPSIDSLIVRTYDARTLDKKAENKAALQTRAALSVDANRMLFGLVGRLTSQKGIDLIVGGAEALLAQGAQLVILGSGDPELERALQALRERHPAKVGVTLGFDEKLAHQIEAGADCFLMPSRFEPCGLNQMYSMAYGTPPIVSPVGGLVDSVIDAGKPDGCGFVMRDVSQASFDEAVNRAVAAWRKPQWRELQTRGMARPMGWGDAAKAYSTLFRNLANVP